MKKLFLPIALILCLLVEGNAQSPMDQFGNEKLQYRIRYGFIVGGEMTVTSKRKIYEGNNTFHAVCDMRTIGLVDNIFRLHDIFESYLDAKTLLPYLFIRDAHEGDYEQYEQVRYYDKHVESTVKGRFDTGRRTHDIVSAYYTLRVYDYSRLKPDDVIQFSLYYDEQVIPIKVVYKGIETVKLNKINYSCIKLIPIMGETSVLEKKNPITMWITNDWRRIPIAFKVNMKVGAFRVELM